MSRLYTLLLSVYVLMMPIALVSAGLNMLGMSTVHTIYAVFLFVMAALTYVIYGLAVWLRKVEKAVYFLVAAQSALVLGTVLLAV